ncbi:MAG: FG-GAP-like repeat-containing protein [Acidobacteriota bacterium]|nr:FG-GAP-like repeat-containing protein [Acidobacteriota bacterium]
MHTRENKTSLSRLAVGGKATDYLRAIKQRGVLRGSFNPVNNGQIKLLPDDFAASGEIDQESLAPQAQPCSTLSFATSNFDVGIDPTSVTTGDFNGDGKLDLATANSNENTVSVLLGDGTGGFSMATNFGVGNGPRAVTTGDFNGDGKLDLATANSNENTVSVLLGDGTGGFGAATSFGVGSLPISITTGDFNGDGRLDLATANNVSNNVSVLLSNGTGGFSAASNFLISGTSPFSITTGDFNGDGRLDLATANIGSDNVSVLLGNGTGGFNSTAVGVGVGNDPLSITTGDFNGDGRLDLATANYGSDNVSVLLGNGTGGFSTASNFPVSGTNPQSITTGDFNGDGRLDLATANTGSANVSILFGDGTGGFGAATSFGVGSLPTSITTGDFNGDGRLDLAAANLFFNGVTVLLNTCTIIPGDLDPSFGPGGITITAIGASSQANATVIQPDGKIIVAGTSFGNPDSGFALARYNTDGTLDNTFGTGGKVFTFVGSKGQSYAVALQSDGKIVAAGFADNGANNDFAVARYNTDGTLDPAFDIDGIVIVPIGAGSDQAYAVAVQTDGRIVVAGQSNNGTNDQIALVRLNANGSLDNSFDGDGKVTAPVTSGSEYAFAMRIQSDGKIVTAGYSGSPNIDFLIARFNTNGSLDTAFGTNGKVFTNFGGNDYSTALALTPDDKIVAAGFTNANATNDFTVARYNTNGSLDTSFDGDGKATTIDVNSRDEAFAVAVQPNGRILVGGTSTVNENQDFSLIRYNFDGSLDTTFGTNGKVTTSLGNMEDVIRALAIQPDGYAVAAGYKQINSQAYNFAVARYALGEVNGCGYSITPIVSSIGSAGATVNFNVTSSDVRCAYTAASNNSFITITSGASGTGNGAVSFSVAPNTGPARTGTITVGGQTFTITQASGCTFTLSPTSASLPGNAGTGTFNITGSDTGCSYTVVSNASFITITSGSSGTGSGTVSYSITANTGSVRTGTITVGGQTFTITQAALPTLTINNVTLNEGNNVITAFNFTVTLVGASSQTVTVNFATTNGTATAPDDYQSAAGSLSFAPGETIKTVTVLVIGDTEVEPNETFTVNLSNPTNATISNGQGTGTILDDDACIYSISPTSINIPASGASINVISLMTQKGCQWNAVSNNSWITILGGSSGKGNGTVFYSVAANTGPARTGTITVGGQTFTIYQASGNNTLPTRFDFDGDGKADVSVFRPSNGGWYIDQSTNGFTGIIFGQAGDKIVPADYDGDGKTDVAVFRSGTWYLNRSQLGFIAIEFGAADDIPQPADFDGDGRAELAVFRPSNGYWYVLLVTNEFTAVQFGQNGDKPVVADYDGDGKADYAVYRNGSWYMLRSSLGFIGIQLGEAADRPVPADYDGDGKADVAVYRPSNSTWYLNRTTAGFAEIQFGVFGDVPAPADYDGDGRADIAVFRPSNSTWYLNRTTAGFMSVQFGATNDIPVPSAFVP